MYGAGIQSGLWQFMVLPENNPTQQVKTYFFKNSLGALQEESRNGFGFPTLRVTTQKPINNFEFSLSCTLEKKEDNPFNSLELPHISQEHEILKSVGFKAAHESFLTSTPLTRIPKKFETLITFNPAVSLFDNLLRLNKWSFDYFTFTTDVTSTETLISDVLESKKGVCQDFTHVFCGLARLYGIPTRYVSGYLHQGKGLTGDSQMHAWIEAFVPERGWVGFDPTNNLLADYNYIKVCHGRDYKDCAPLKGVVRSSSNDLDNTSYTVTVQLLPEEKKELPFGPDLPDAVKTPLLLENHQQRQQQQ